tara:strand:- start:4041 stop:4802 length:762 start_codon:yes stop_codon:yes gene_type:complete
MEVLLLNKSLYMLHIKNIKKSIKEKVIIDDISFCIKRGKIFGLLGPNGAGKTSTFYIIAGLTYQDSGEIFLSNENISNAKMHQRSKLGIKYLPQEPSIFQNLTVYENLLGLAEITFNSKEKIKNVIQSSIKDFDLSNILDLKGRQLSGGQRRKVEIARTLVSMPKFILLDEPFAGIDPIAIEEIKSVLITLAKKDIGVLITDHNVRDALEICSEAIVINEGKVIANGTKSELVNNKIVQKVYIGDMYKNHNDN